MTDEEILAIVRIIGNNIPKGSYFAFAVSTPEEDLNIVVYANCKVCFLSAILAGAVANGAVCEHDSDNMKVH